MIKIIMIVIHVKKEYITITCFIVCDEAKSLFIFESSFIKMNHFIFAMVLE